jgi:UDP-N-acetylmuramoylalanine--D-glutamate ligase
LNGDRFANRLAEFVGGKNVLVLGFGKEGRSTGRVLTDVGGYSRLDVADGSPAVSEYVPSGAAFISDGYMDALENYDIVIKSPGIVLPDFIKNLKCQITCQADIFLGEYSKQTIGITGTKGKSTVATLLHHTLETAGREVVLAGNIGIPVFDVAAQVTPETVAVVELSCHQLQHCSHSPSYAALLNLYEDHLDYYGTFCNYAKAKANIYSYQSERDVLYTHLKDLPITIKARSQVRDVLASDLPFSRFEDIGGVKLFGQHNLLNAAFVYKICRDIGVGDEAFISALRTYVPLRHRIEFIGSKNGVGYYDDSISTTAESTICAVQSVPNAKTLILGGVDRGIDYSGLVDFLIDSDLELIIGMYDSGKRIRDLFLLRCAETGGARFAYVDDLYQAAGIAQKNTPPGTACILSPAAASYGNFANFEERGDVFRKILFGIQ